MTVHYELHYKAGPLSDFINRKGRIHSGRSGDDGWYWDRKAAFTRIREIKACRKKGGLPYWKGYSFKVLRVTTTEVKE